MKYSAHGKLLLTHEYLVLDGAKSIALPTLQGQTLEVAEMPFSEVLIEWKALEVNGEVWAEVTLNRNLEVEATSDKEVATHLQAFLKKASALNPNILSSDKSYQITTQLEFHRHWGLGSSSTVLSLIAQWFNVNVFELQQGTFAGSGYDLACANAKGPIEYQILNGVPRVENIEWPWLYQANLFVVYLNQKQNSREAIDAYRAQQNNIAETILEVNRESEDWLNCSSLSEFMRLMERHESRMSEILKQTPVKERLFSDFNGAVKSLGAWGGDFVLVACEQNPVEYFKNKGYTQVFKLNTFIR